MIGREAECAAVVAALSAGVGSVIVGEPGVGKSVLAAEIAARQGRSGWLTALVLGGGRAALAPQAFRDLLAGTGKRLLVVDDAHLLDDDSAAALWRLAREARVVLLATVRHGVRTPDEVTRLWTSGVCDRLDLLPLGEADVRMLLEQVLGGDVDDRLARLLVERAAGNSLLIRELINGARAGGSIRRSHNVWRLVGSLPVGRSVADLIRDSLSGLSDQETAAAQLLAVGEPMPLRTAEALVESGLLEALEARRIVVAHDSADGPTVTLAHPLYGEVIRAGLSPIRSRRLRLQLIAALTDATEPTDRDLVRSALWRLELHEPIATAELLRAARRARPFAALAAEQLARVAAEREPSPDAVVTLAEILLMQGRIAEADRSLDAVDVNALTEAERQRVTSVRALGRTRLGEVSAAAALLSAGGETSSLQLQALHGQALMLDGRIAEAAGVARPVFADETADPVARAYAAFTLAAGATFAGALDDTEPVLRAALPLTAATQAAVPYGIATVQVSTVIALACAGRLDEAEQLAGEMYDHALRDDDEWLAPRGASGLGVVALLRGQVRTATTHFRITVAALNDFDGLFLRYNLSYLARAAAAAGLLDDARQALNPPPDAPAFPIFQADWQIAEASLLAATDEPAAGAASALNAARAAAALGAWTPSLFAAHDAVRYGAGANAATLVRAAADQLDTALAAALAEHALGRATNDPLVLEAASARLEQLGTILYAAEASYFAAHAHRNRGDGRAAARASVRATALHARCENAHVPWISPIPVAGLTLREREIALLAAAGYPDAVIAARLTISPRTVQAHLLRVYHKLAISNRHALPGALTVGTATDPDPAPKPPAPARASAVRG